MMGRRFFLRGLASLPFVGAAAACVTVVAAPRVLATGGVVSNSRSFLVGERGPEMIVPLQNCRIDTRRAMDDVRAYREQLARIPKTINTKINVKRWDGREWRST